MPRMPTTRWWRGSLALNLSATTLAACGGGGSSGSSELPRGCTQVPKPASKHVDLRPPATRVSRDARLTAKVDTSCGSFVVALDAARWPKTVSSFVHLARRGVYGGTTFQRIVPDFVIQGGDPTESGRGGAGYSVTERPPPTTQYRRGTVAMAKTPLEPRGHSSSQFFVVTAADAGLPPNYAVLGKVSAGWDAVSRIASLGDPASGQLGTPDAVVAIHGITVRSR
jgi:peptidyl-prolyl cis-trans isomerase B (cyclophilin B)